MINPVLVCGQRSVHPAPERPKCRRKEPAIDTDSRSQQGDLIVGLLKLLERNRLALVVLAASLTHNARSRARGAYADSSAVQWLARNARLVRHFLASLSVLRRCAGQAGYLALGRARPERRLATAPRRLLRTAASLTPSAASWMRGGERMRLVPAAVRL
jgi:hypothetical protein